MNKEKKYSAEKITAIAIENLESQIDRLKAKVKALEQQLANIKYLNAVKVEDIFYSMIKPHFIDNKFDDDNSLVSRDKFEEAIQAICNLAIPEIKQKREDIIEILSRKHMDFLTREEIIKEQTNEIIKAIRGEE